MPWLALFSIVVHGAVLIIAPGDGTWVDRAYARTAYPAVAPVLGFIPNLVPFSVTLVTAAVLILALIGSSVVLAVSWCRRCLGAATRGLATGWIVVAALVFHGFFIGWGYNYLRPALATRIAWPPFDGADANALRMRLIADTNAAHTRVTDWDVDVLNRAVTAAVNRAARALGDRGLPFENRLKPPLPAGLLAAIGTYGFISPWFLETHVDLRLPPTALAFTAAHEKAHLAGYAPEDEANFVAWLALTTDDDPRLRYAGHLGVVGYALTNDNVDALSPAVKADLRAIAAYRRAHVTERLERGAKIAYRAYLRANRVEGGLASYAAVIRLIARYERTQTPARRTLR